MDRKPDQFFTLIEPYAELSEPKDFWRAVEGDDKKDIRDLLYKPDRLESVEPPKKWRVRNKRFYNVSFARTVISQIEFTDCHFESCLFVGSVVSDCRFNNCHFVSCNFYRSEIRGCFIDPQSFSKCLDPKRHANIGVGLYQELLHNSRQQVQPEFTNLSQYQFIRWKRYLKWDEIEKSNLRWSKKFLKRFALLPAWAFEITTGSGVRLSNLAISSSLMLLTITLLNHYFSVEFGLKLSGEPIASIMESFYFSTIVVTSLGFGDITPGTDLGRFVIACEAIAGFLTFAVLVSMAFRKISS